MLLLLSLPSILARTAVCVCHVGYPIPGYVELGKDLRVGGETGTRVPNQHQLQETYLNRKTLPLRTRLPTKRMPLSRTRSQRQIPHLRSHRCQIRQSWAPCETLCASAEEGPIPRPPPTERPRKLSRRHSLSLALRALKLPRLIHLFFICISKASKAAFELETPDTTTHPPPTFFPTAMDFPPFIRFGTAGSEYPQLLRKKPLHRPALHTILSCLLTFAFWDLQHFCCIERKGAACIY